ncbi:hypothetical protein MHYP_G00360170 [Metynnis hypsauchen]
MHLAGYKVPRLTDLIRRRPQANLLQAPAGLSCRLPGHTHQPPPGSFHQPPEGQSPPSGGQRPEPGCGMGGPPQNRPNIWQCLHGSAPTRSGLAQRPHGGVCALRRGAMPVCLPVRH